MNWKKLIISVWRILKENITEEITEKFTAAERELEKATLGFFYGWMIALGSVILVMFLGRVSGYMNGNPVELLEGLFFGGGFLQAVLVWLWWGAWIGAGKPD